MVLPILVLSLGLGLYNLGTESLWIDELYSIYDATKVNLNPVELLARFTQIRPLYYVLLRIWMVFGENEVWLRSLSVIFGVGGVFLTYRLGRKVAGQSVGILASLMLALSPMFVHFSQMVRMYALGLLLGLLGSYFLILVLEAPKTKYFAGWAISRSLMFLATPLNLTLLLPDLILLGATFRKQPQTLKGLWKWLLLLGILCLPSAYSLIAKSLPFLQKAVGLKESVETAKQTSTFNLPLDLFRKIKKFTVFPFPSTSATMSRAMRGFTLVLLSLTAVGFYKSRYTGWLLAIAGWAFLPWLIHAAVAKQMLFDRYVFYTAPYLIILVAAGLVRIWHMNRAIAAGIAIAYALIVTMGLGRYYGVQDRQDWRALFEFINQQEQPGDTIIYSRELANPEKFTNALRYYHKGDAPMVLIRQLCEHDSVTQPEAVLTFQQVSAPLQQTWLLCGREFEPDKFQTILGEYGEIEGHWQFVNEAFYRQEDYMNLFKVRLTP
ncbi:MAG: glycosyltransferase family 39 protein [Leptolyngbyaceae cyanobacterium]